MAGRSRAPVHPLHLRDPPPPSGLYGRPPPQAGLYGRPPPDVLPLRPHPLDPRDDPRRRLPVDPHAAILALEDRLAAQNREIQDLLIDNQRLAATHVALKQELTAAERDLHIIATDSAKARDEREAEVRAMYERAAKTEAEARGVEGMREELEHVREDLVKLGANRDELVERLRGLQKEHERAKLEVAQVPEISAEIEAMHREIQRGRAHDCRGGAMQQWRPEAPPAMTSDEVSLERGKSFAKALQRNMELAIDLISRRSEFFKDAAAVRKVMTVVSAAKARADAEVAAAKAKEEAEVKKKEAAATEAKVKAEAEVQKPLEKDAVVEEKKDPIPSAEKAAKNLVAGANGKIGDPKLRRREIQTKLGFRQSSEMGVFTFVCRSSGDEWTAKPLSGDIEASAGSTYDLQRKLVQAALSKDSSGGVSSSFSLVTPSSAVFQVIIGGGGGGGFVGGGGASSDGAAAGSAGGAAVAEAPAVEEKKEEKEESDDDMGFSLFD